MKETIVTSSMDKPHKGRIIVTGTFDCEGVGLGYGYFCKFLDHEDFAGEEGYTSYIVASADDVPRHASDAYEIETRNSRYTVVPKNYVRDDESYLASRLIPIAQDLQNPERSSRPLELIHTDE